MTLPKPPRPQIPPGRELLYQELHGQYNKEFELRDSLDGKANNMITISSAVATLLFGFGTILIDRSGGVSINMITAIAFLISGVLLAIASLVLCVWASRIQNYVYAMGHSIFYKDKPRHPEDFDNAELELWKSFADAEFRDYMINSYLVCIRENSGINLAKARKIKTSQVLFITGVFTIPAIALLLVFNILYDASMNDKKTQLFLYCEEGKVSETRVLGVRGNYTQVELSLISTGTVNGIDFRSAKTVSYSLKPDGTITDGRGQGIIKTPGRTILPYTLNFSGKQNNDFTDLDGILLFNDRQGKIPSTLDIANVTFKAKINLDDSFILRSLF